MKLLPAILKAARFTSTRGIIPNLDHVTVDRTAVFASDGLASITVKLTEMQATPFTIEGQRAEVILGGATIDATSLSGPQRLHGDPVKFSLKDSMLTVSRGKTRFRCPQVEPMPDPVDALPFGQDCIRLTEILPAMRALLPFVADDASKPWARAVHFTQHGAYATNNVVLAYYPCRTPWEFALLPRHVELLTSTFDECDVYLENGKLYALTDSVQASFCLVEGTLPSAVPDMIATVPDQLEPVPEGLADTLSITSKLAGTVPLLVCECDRDTLTARGDSIVEHAVPGLDAVACKVSHKMLSLVVSRATHLRLRTPHSYFHAGDARGLFVGVI